MSGVSAYFTYIQDFFFFVEQTVNKCQMFNQHVGMQFFLFLPLYLEVREKGNESKTKAQHFVTSGRN